MRLTLAEMKVSLSGAAVALAAGVLLGGAMQPQLYEGDRPSGPQMFADWAGARSTGPFDPGASFVNDQGKIPDYVMGADWKRRMAWPDGSAAVPAPREPARNDAPPPEPPTVLTRAAYEDPPPPPHAYPSLGGSAPSVIDLPSPADDTTAPAAGG